MRLPALAAGLLLLLSGCQGGEGPEEEGLGDEPDEKQDDGQEQDMECPGHWHASFDVYVHGDRMSYEHPKFQLEGNQGMPVRTHLHRSADWQWHFEPVDGEECIPFQEALATVDTELEPGRLVLDGGHADLNQAGTFEDGANGTLVAFHREDGGDWQPIGIAGLDARQPSPGERILIAYGSAQEMDLEAWEAEADGRQLAQSYDANGVPIAPA